MKKLLAVIFAMLLCISIVSCGKSSDNAETTAKAKESTVPETKEVTEENTLPVVGEWECDNDGTILTVKEDYTGEINNGAESIAFTWTYDSSTCTFYAKSENGETDELIYTESEDSLSAQGYYYYRLEK